MCSLAELPALALAVASCYCTCALAQNEVPASAAAQPKADEETELAPVTVSAHEGVAVPYDSTGVSVSILDIPQLKKEGIYTLSEALTTVPSAAMAGVGRISVLPSPIFDKIYTSPHISCNFDTRPGVLYCRSGPKNIRKKDKICQKFPKK